MAYTCNSILWILHGGIVRVFLVCILCYLCVFVGVGGIGVGAGGCGGWFPLFLWDYLVLGPCFLSFPGVCGVCFLRGWVLVGVRSLSWGVGFGF